MYGHVSPKKHLGQHFLADQNIARKIVDLLQPTAGELVLEVGPGQGVLTQYLLQHPNPLTVVEFDGEAAAYLRTHYTNKALHIVEGDILTVPLPTQPFVLIGNLPYNISSPIFFRILEHHTYIRRAVCMIQREVAQRIAAPPGSKTYGILSVLIGHYYEVKYAFTVGPKVFIPPPRVESAVITLTRRDDAAPADYAQLARVVKAAFNQRRKTLRNALKAINLAPPADMADKRAEQLTIAQFVQLSQLL